MVGLGSDVKLGSSASKSGKGWEERKGVRATREKLYEVKRSENIFNEPASKTDI